MLLLGPWYYRLLLAEAQRQRKETVPNHCIEDMVECDWVAISISSRFHDFVAAYSAQEAFSTLLFDHFESEVNQSGLSILKADLLVTPEADFARRSDMRRRREMCRDGGIDFHDLEHRKEP